LPEVIAQPLTWRMTNGERQADAIDTCSKAEEHSNKETVTKFSLQDLNPHMH
jgi:hypothetical protein